MNLSKSVENTKNTSFGVLGLIRPVMIQAQYQFQAKRGFRRKFLIHCADGCRGCNPLNFWDFLEKLKFENFFEKKIENLCSSFFLLEFQKKI